MPEYLRLRIVGESLLGIGAYPDDAAAVAEYALDLLVVEYIVVLGLQPPEFAGVIVPDYQASVAAKPEFKEGIVMSLFGGVIPISGITFLMFSVFAVAVVQESVMVFGDIAHSVIIAPKF